MSAKTVKAGAFKFRVTPKMVEAFQIAYLKFQDSPLAYRYPLGCEKILAAVLGAARPGDVQALNGAGPRSALLSASKHGTVL